LSLQEVLHRHTAARGGGAALDRVKRIAIDLDITEKGNTVQGRYFADTQGLVRIDIYAEKRLVYREGVDAQGVWLWPGGDARAKPSVAEGAANALHHGAENHLFGLHRFAQRGHKLRLMPPQILHTVQYQVIECGFTTGHVSYFYLDPATWLITRKRDERAYHPDNDPTKAKIETRSSDFVKVQGVVASHRQQDYDLGTGALLSTNHVTRRVLNPILTASLFNRDFVAPETIV